jgi:hypothetical protein
MTVSYGTFDAVRGCARALAPDEIVDSAMLFIVSVASLLMSRAAYGASLHPRAKWKISWVRCFAAGVPCTTGLALTTWMDLRFLATFDSRVTALCVAAASWILVTWWWRWFIDAVVHNNCE